MRLETNKKQAGSLFLFIISVLIVLLLFWQFSTYLLNAYIYYTNAQIVEVTVVRRSKSRLEPKTNILLSEDYYNIAFYVETKERDMLRTDIDTFDNIGRGKEKFTITRKLGSNEWWIIRDWSVPQPMPTWEEYDAGTYDYQE